MDALFGRGLLRPIKTFLNGTWLEHPLHPVLTDIPIGAVCSHLGGPLQEGTVKGDCVECPWHYSQFSLSDGHVHSGPATAPVPAYETRVANGKLQVKRK